VAVGISGPQVVSRRIRPIDLEVESGDFCFIASRLNPSTGKQKWSIPGFSPGAAGDIAKELCPSLTNHNSPRREPALGNAFSARDTCVPKSLA